MLTSNRGLAVPEVKLFHFDQNLGLFDSLLGSCRHISTRVQIDSIRHSEFRELCCDSSALTALFLIASRDKARQILCTYRTHQRVLRPDPLRIITTREEMRSEDQRSVVCSHACNDETF